MKWKSFIVSFIGFVSLTSYSHAQQLPDSSASLQSFYLKNYYTQLFGFPVDSIQNENLYNSIDEWLSTRYKYGGKNKQGIDCSGFVKALYDSAYKIELIGGSGSLFQQVTPLQMEELKEGDLVFFKIRKKRISHVGVYLGNKKFVHASTELGVTISDLEEPYYKKRYFKGGRIRSTVASNQ